MPIGFFAGRCAELVARALGGSEDEVRSFRRCVTTMTFPADPIGSVLANAEDISDAVLKDGGEVGGVVRDVVEVVSNLP